MPYREKVIEILEKAKTVIEKWIPMFEQYNTPAGIDDAIALLKKQEEQIKNRDESLEKAREEIKWLREMLKGQEPRVLTADELYLMEHKCVYLERRNSKVYSTEPSIVIGTPKALFCQYKYILMRENKISDVRYSSDYNKETKSGWRCWSAKPTEERRKEVKWE